MVARIVWYKIVHVGDFILLLLILYLFFLYIYLRIPLYLGLRGGTSIFSDMFFVLFVPSFLYEFT